MTIALDPEGAHLASLERLARFAGARMCEVGCGEGRLTASIAPRAASIFAFDPDADRVAAAEKALPARLADRVTFRVGSAREIEIPRSEFDIVLFSWSLWWMEPEDVVHVLRRFRESLVLDGLILDLQVIRPNPVVELDGRVVCTIDGEPLLAAADAATAEVDRMVEAGLLANEAVDDHDVLKHYASGRLLVEDFRGKERTIPADAIPELERIERPVTVRERCRSRRLRRRGA